MFSTTSLNSDGFNWNAALSLAVASQLAYEQERTVRHIATTVWGLRGCEFIDTADTQAFVAHHDECVVVAFRGIENIADWITNLQVFGTDQPYGRVHSGFHAAFTTARQQISNVLRQIDTSHRRIWLTGHSLGGAVATIAAAELKEEFPITGCYTYGQPRVGDTAVREFIKTYYRDAFFRFVNDDDIVTRVPPGYRHVGLLFHFDETGRLRSEAAESDDGRTEDAAITKEQLEQLQEQIRQLRRAVSQTKSEKSPKMQEAVVNASVEGLLPSVSDQNLNRYIALINRFAGRIKMDPSIDSPQMSAEGLDFVASPFANSRKLQPVLLRVRDSGWKAPSGLKVNSRIGTIITVQATPDELRELASDPEIVSIEASRDGGRSDCAISVPFVGGDIIHQPTTDERGDSALVGMIDTGIDILHESFRDSAGKSRILAIWNQRDDTGPTPNEIDSAAFTQDYGTFYVRGRIQQFIDDFIADPSTVIPAALRDPGPASSAGHGTHVASIAAGRAAGAFAGGMAPESRLLVVIPNMSTSPGDPLSLGYSNSHVDALSLLRAAGAKEKLPMVVNVSLGMNAGAHDGTSTLEAAFDAVSGNGRDVGFVIVKSAGNERGNSGHARVQMQTGVIRPIVWESLPQFRFEDYIEIWYSSFDDLSFTLVDPAGNSSAAVSARQTDVTATLAGNFCKLTLTQIHPDNGDNRLVVIIRPDAASIQTGDWRLKIEGLDVFSRDGRVDGWVEQDRGRAVRFKSGDNDEMTLSIPGTAKTVITVSACKAATPLELTDSSSFGPTRDFRPKPDVCAPGHEITAAHSNTNNPLATVSMTGTSMAAPHVTGALALVLSRRHKNPNRSQLNAQQLQAALIRNTKNFTGLHNEGFGYGALDAAKLIKHVDTMP